MGERRGLGSKWLNDDAKIFISPIKPRGGSLCGRLDRSKSGRPIPCSLLAMKLRASRGQRDQGDLTLLLEECQIETVEGAIALFEEYYPEDPLPDQAEVMIRFSLRQRSTSGDGSV